MIYLIGGPPKCGKTTLAKKLSKELGISYISADTLQSVAFGYTDQDEIAKKFPWREIREKTGRNNDLVYGKYLAEEIVGFYQEQAKASAVAIEMVVASEINDGNDYIIEGYQVEPQLAKNLIEKYGPEKIKAVFLGRENKENLLEDMQKSSTPNDWILAGTKKAETFEKIAEMICAYSEKFKKEAEDCGFQFFAMDNNFDEKIKEVIRFLK